MEATKTHVPILNFLRAFASLSVCIVHLHYMVGLEKYPIGKLLVQGQGGVAVFFVISGFVIPYSLWNYNYTLKNFFRYLWRRAIRIDPPYLVIVLVSILLLGQVEPIRFVFHLLYIIPFSGYDWYQSIFWTLGIEFQFYILIGLCFPLLKKGNIYLVIAIILLLSGTGYFITRSHNFIFHSIHYFGYGILVLLIKKERILLKIGHLLLLALTVFLCLKISIITGLIGYVTALAIIHLSFENALSNFLGRISYSLYLTHTLTGGLLLALFKSLFPNIYGLFFALLLCCITVAIVYYLYIEKTALRWSKSIKLNLVEK